MTRVTSKPDKDNDPQQLPLALEMRPALGRDDFMVADCNSEAVAWIDQWPKWPAPALCLYGPKGCGKSHLAEVWRARSGALQVAASDLNGINPDELLGDATGLVIEDADLVAGAGLDETVCFHIYNMLKERGGHLLLTASQPPSRWQIDLPDLKSRLGAALVCEISPPDDDLIVGLLIKLFADRQIPASPQIISYVLPRIERSFAALSQLVAAIDRRALAEKRAVTLPLVRSVMDDMTTQS
ncbi:MULTISPECIES: DnaA/Hda family protein [Thalassospira]|uniref:HdaA/DnaA family protein n=1 Tax=Thalassospira TaxID=168934 RepID=UPI00028722B9|nr:MULTISPECIES: DnaA/Hda family protein [Thalassospira]EKF07166.1 chromosomal replication initiator [Thalassospira profundimaris WP0211]BDW89578.1 regulatory inactivation of DnaA Hda protein [Thalassospira tepidiphila]